MAIVNKLIFNFRDSNDKDVFITISKVDSYTATMEEKADDIAETILANKACLNLDLQYLKGISHTSENTTPIIKDGEQV